MLTEHDTGQNIDIHDLLSLYNPICGHPNPMQINLKELGASAFSELDKLARANDNKPMFDDQNVRIAFAAAASRLVTDRREF